MSNEELKELSKELTFKLLLLQQRISVYDELMLHKSRALNEKTAKFYVAAMNQYGNFFVAVENSLVISLYVELLSFLGVKLNKNNEIIHDIWGDASLYRLAEGKNDIKEFLELITKHKFALGLIDEIRHHVAHAKRVKETTQLLMPGYHETVGLLNDASAYLMKVHDEVRGIVGWNKPHLLNEENEAANDTEELLAAISKSPDSEGIRSEYLSSKQKMRENYNNKGAI